MSVRVVHVTPGLIDLRAFTTMGMSAKPNSSSPIGMFGTGLKYSVATLVRLGARPVVWIGRDRYEFRLTDSEFRGVEFQQVEMVIKKFTLLRSSRTLLPYTTNYGKFWKPWMVVRELEANTRDENGASFLTEEEVTGEEGVTKLVIDLPEYVAAFRDLGNIFLPGASKGESGVQIIEGESRHVYWRGLRVMDLPKPSAFTYNILSWIELTEDRTAKYDFLVRSSIAKAVTKLEDPELIRRIITTGSGCWEHGLNFDNSWEPSEAFHSVIASKPKGVWSSALPYFARHDRATERTPDSAWDSHPHPWAVEDGNKVVDANGVTVFDCPIGYAGRWADIGMAIITRLLPRLPYPDEPTPEADPDDRYKVNLSAEYVHEDLAAAPELAEELERAAEVDDGPRSVHEALYTPQAAEAEAEADMYQGYVPANY